MKRLIFIFLSSITLANCQTPIYDPVTAQADYLGYWTGDTLAVLIDSLTLASGLNGPSEFRIKTKKLTIKSCNAAHAITQSKANIIMTDALGTIYAVAPGSLPLTYSQVTTALGYSPGTQVTNYNTGGVINITKRWIGLVTPSTSNGYSINISSAGFINVLNVQVIASRNTATVTSSPQVSIKTTSTTAVVVNITESSMSLVTVLGLSVLGSLPVIFANTTGLSLYVLVEGN